MKKAIKIALFTVIGLILLVVVAAGVALVVIDPNDYKDDITTMIAEKTGWKAEFKGPLELKVFPSLGAGASNVQIYTDPAFGQKPMASLQNLKVTIAILPLLSGQIAIDSIVLDGLDVYLVTDAKGKNNWDLTPAAQSSPPASAQKAHGTDKPSVTVQASDSGTAGDDTGKQKNQIKAEVHLVSIANCKLEYVEQGSKQDFAINVQELKVKNLALNSDIELQLKVAFEDKVAKNSGNLELGGHIKYAPVDGIAMLDAETLKLIFSAPQVSAEQVVDGKIKVEANLGNKSGQMDIQLKNKSLNLNLQAKVQDFGLNSQQGAGSFDFKSNPREFLAALGIKPATSDANVFKDLALSFKFDLADNMLKVNNFKGNFDGTAITATDTYARLPGAKGLPQGVDYLVNVKLALGALNIDRYLPPAGKSTSAKAPASVKGQTPPSATAMAKSTPANGAPLQGAVNITLDLEGVSTALPMLEGARSGKAQEFKVNALANLVLGKTINGRFSLKAVNPNLDLSLQANASNLSQTAKITGSLALNAKPRNLMNWAGIKLDNVNQNSFNTLNLNSSYVFSANELKISDLSGKFDATTFKSSHTVKIEGAKGLPKGILYALDSNITLGSLNIESYLPPEKHQKDTGVLPPPTAAKSGQKAAQGLLKGTPLEQALATVNLRMSSLKYGKLDINNIVLAMDLNRGNLNIRNLELHSFDGTAKSSISADLLQAVPPVKVKSQLRGLDLEKALNVLLANDNLVGKLNAGLDLSFKGLDQHSIYQTLNGNGNFELLNGKAQHMDFIPSYVPKEISKYRSRDYSFDKVHGSFTATNGLIRNNDLEFLSKNFNIKGKGEVNLPHWTINYQTIMTMRDNKLVLPMVIKGSLDKIETQVDEEEMAKGIAAEGIRQLQKKGAIPTEEEAKKKIGKELNRLMKKI